MKKLSALWGCGMSAKSRRFNNAKSLIQTGNILKLFDFYLWIPVLILSVIGILFIYSSGLNVEGDPHYTLIFPTYLKQLIWVILGIFIALFFSLVSWRDLSLFSLYLLPVLVLMLIITNFLPSHAGTHSWIRLGPFSLQPSEITKPFFILALSFILTRYQKLIQKPLYFLAFFSLSFVPAGLIVLQRDMGTASVYLPIIFILFWRAGADKKILGGTMLFAALLYLLTIIAAWSYFKEIETILYQLINNPAARITVSLVLFLISAVSLIGKFIYKKKYYYWIFYFSVILLAAYICSFSTAPSEKGFGLLGRYQVERLVYPLDNDLDLETSYNIEQARTAIGSGGLTGKGYLKGNLSHRRFVPEQPTDFIFSILGEEWGWIGSFFVLLLYLCLLIRIIIIMTETTDIAAFLILSALFVLYFYHMTINIGMNIGVVPVIGIPLMFVSYGGTAIWTAFIGIGIIQNISRTN